MKPFVFLDYFDIDPRRMPPIGFHPHSGIETVTVVLQGQLSYQETSGTEGVIDEGGVEWMHAGGGVWHCGGPVGSARIKGYQLWIALPPEEENSVSEARYVDVDLGLPVTSKLQDQILEVNPPPEEAQREAFISRRISGFWREVFGWTGSRTRPALEDHFTQSDLAANSGHYLGMVYGPKKLRALRRMTIHRIFTLLDIEPTAAPHIDALIHRLLSAFDLSIVTTNWDIMAERCLERQHAPFFYSRQSDPRRPPQPVTGIPVWKLHG
jgi:hypothetical protein